MFLLSQNDENQSENGSKNSKIRLRARPPAEPQKKMLQTKKLRSKSWKTRDFFTFRLPILDGRVHEQVSSVLFFTVFFEGERHDLSKTGGFGRKMPPPPPGKPVTFYECHPEDHAPAPSVRADLFSLWPYDALQIFSVQGRANLSMSCVWSLWLWAISALSRLADLPACLSVSLLLFCAPSPSMSPCLVVPASLKACGVVRHGSCRVSFFVIALLAQKYWRVPNPLSCEASWKRIYQFPVAILTISAMQFVGSTPVSSLSAFQSCCSIVKSEYQPR